MKFNIELPSKPCHMEQRVVTRFALLPTRCDDEVRWLEKVTIMQIYLMNPIGHWVNDYFIN